MTSSLMTLMRCHRNGGCWAHSSCRRRRSLLTYCTSRSTITLARRTTTTCTRPTSLSQPMYCCQSPPSRSAMTLLGAPLPNI